MADETRKKIPAPPLPPKPGERKGPNRDEIVTPTAETSTVDDSKPGSDSFEQLDDPTIETRIQRACRLGRWVLLALGVVFILQQSINLYGKIRGSVETPIVAAKSQEVDIHCELTFLQLKNEQLDEIEETIRKFAKDVKVENEGRGGMIGEQQERVKFVFTNPGGLLRLAELDTAISYQVQNGRATNLAYDQFDAKFTASYQTATLSGSIETIVRFKVAKDAKLWFSLKPGVEKLVPEEQIVNGEVALTLRIPRSALYVYARTELGRVEQCLRINVSTSVMENISRDEYDNRPDEQVQQQPEP